MRNHASATNGTLRAFQALNSDNIITKNKENFNLI